MATSGLDRNHSIEVSRDPESGDIHTALDLKLDRWEVRKSFSRAADEYDANAWFALEVGGRLRERLDSVRLQPRGIVDLGAGTGQGARALAKRYKKAVIHSVDMTYSLLARGHRRSLWSSRRTGMVCAYMERLPFKSAVFDLAYSNLALPWCSDVEPVLSEAHRVLQEGGLLSFSTLGPGTLKELREAWASVDSYPHVHLFIDMHDIGDALTRLGFADVVMETERLAIEYARLERLFSDLKRCGATNLTSGRRRSLTGKHRYASLCRAYEQQRVHALPVSVEVIYAHAWKPAVRHYVRVALPELRR